MRKLQKSKFAQSLIPGLFWAYRTQLAFSGPLENRSEAHVRKSLLEGIQPSWLFFFPNIEFFTFGLTYHTIIQYNTILKQQYELNTNNMKCSPYIQPQQFTGEVV